MTSLPTILSRPGAFVVAGFGAWPVAAYGLASVAGIDGCVRAHGVAGFVATHGAMMRAVPSCPTASVGLPGVIDSAIAFFLAAAIFTTALQVLIAVVAAHGAEWVHRLVEAISGLIAPALRTRSCPPNYRPVPVDRAQPFLLSFNPGVPWRRGPPRLVLAA